MEKEEVAHTHNKILLSLKKEWNLVICNNMDGPRGYYLSRNKSDEDKYHKFHLYVESKKNKWTNKTETNLQTQKKMMVSKWEGGGEMSDKGRWD